MSKANSSKNWIKGHVKDPFVIQAQKDGYRSRAAYKLNEIDKKYYYGERYKDWKKINDGITKTIDENVLYQYRRYYIRENKNNVCPTLTANMGGGGHNVPLLRDKNGVRKLTPRECFNLQGFNENYKLPEISDSALYKLAGNAITYEVSY